MACMRWTGTLMWFKQTNEQTNKQQNKCCRDGKAMPADEKSKRPQYGEGRGKIWLGNLKCSGKERNLAECVNGDKFDIGYCEHNEDVGVQCCKFCYSFHSDQILLNQNRNIYVSNFVWHLDSKWCHPFYKLNWLAKYITTRDEWNLTNIQGKCSIRNNPGITYIFTCTCVRGRFEMRNDIVMI